MVLSAGTSSARKFSWRAKEASYPSYTEPVLSLSLPLCFFACVCDCTCVYDCWQTILKQELWTAFYLNGEGWAIGDGMWTMSAVVWTDGDDSDDEIPYDTSSGDE